MNDCEPRRKANFFTADSIVTTHVYVDGKCKYCGKSLTDNVTSDCPKAESPIRDIRTPESDWTIQTR